MFVRLSGHLKQLALNSCKKLETRLVRQETLFNDFLDLTEFRTDFKQVNLTKFYNRYNSYKPSDLLRGLYFNASRTHGNPNMFNLPAVNFIAKELLKNKTNHTTSLREKYFQKFDELNNNSSFQRLRPKDKYESKVIIKNKSDYDKLIIDYLYTDEEGKLITRDDFDGKKSLPEKMYIHLIEKYDPQRGLDSYDIENILKQASPDKYIDRLEGIVIKNKFGDFPVYEIEPYDMHYGLGSFNHVILDLMDPALGRVGDVTIRNQKTIDLIEKTAVKVDKILSRKLINDLITNSIHSHNDTWIRIGKLMSLYRIEGYELLFAMYHNTEEFGLGILNKKDPGFFTLEKAKELVSSEKSIDYLHGRAIKNSFITEIGQEQTILIKKYDDYNKSGSFYQALFKLMRDKLFCR